MFRLYKPLTKLALVSTISLGTIGFVNKPVNCTHIEYDHMNGTTKNYPYTEHFEIPYTKYLELQKKIIILSNMTREYYIKISFEKEEGPETFFGFKIPVEQAYFKHICHPAHVNKHKIALNYLNSLKASKRNQTNEFVFNMRVYMENPVDNSKMPQAVSSEKIKNLILPSSLRYSDDELIEMMVNNEEINMIIEQVCFLLTTTTPAPLPLQQFVVKHDDNIVCAF